MKLFKTFAFFLALKATRVPRQSEDSSDSSYSGKICFIRVEGISSDIYPDKKSFLFKIIFLYKF